MEYLLFSGYLVLFAWLVTKVKFFTRSGLTVSQIIIIYLLKVMAGILYGWVGIYYANMAQLGDSWVFHIYGLKEYQLLQTNPAEYFTNLFSTSFEGGYLKFLSGENSFWNELKAKSMIKLLSIFDIFSFGNYYVNTIFYSFLTLFGPIAVYRVMKDYFPGKNILVGFAVFFIPSFLFWTSGIHKEGLIFTGIGLVMYNVYFALIESKLRVKRLLYILVGLFLILFLRNFLLVMLIPALITWLIAARFPGKALQIFAFCYLVFGFLFFTAPYISSKLNFPEAVVEKQKEFLTMDGGSMVPVKELEPTVKSFATTLPQAFTLSSIRPYPGDVKHILSLVAAIEINLILLLFIVFLFFKIHQSKNRSLIYFCVFFSFTVLLSIGYTVNFLGAIVRYRSIVIPLLVVPMIASIDWKKIATMFRSRRESQAL